MEIEDEHVEDVRYRVPTSRPTNAVAVSFPCFPAAGRAKLAKQEREKISSSQKLRKEAPSDTPKSSQHTLP